MDNMNSTPPPSTPMEEKYTSNASFNKKKYALLVSEMMGYAHQCNIDTTVVTTLIEKLCKILQFDPTLPTCTAEQKDKVIQWRKNKMAETGSNYYQLVGRKYYETHKQQCKEYVRRYRSKKTPCEFITG